MLARCGVDLFGRWDGPAAVVGSLLSDELALLLPSGLSDCGNSHSRETDWLLSDCEVG